MYSPDENWSSFDSLSGRRISRRKTSPTDFEYFDVSGLRFGTSKLRAKRKLGSEFVTAKGSFQTVRGTLPKGSRRSPGDYYLALERTAKASEPELLMRSTVPFGWVKPSSEKPYGTPSQWSLPDGTRLAAFCVGRYEPYHVLLLRSGRDIRVALRFLAPRIQVLRRWFGIRESTNFIHGEAVISEDRADLPDLLPILVFGFEVLQAMNTVPRGG
jgi:hypothetical protein